MKKFIGILSTAALGGFIALSIQHFMVSTPPVVQNSALQPQVKYVNMPGSTVGNVDFVSAAENTVHAVVHVKTTYKNEPISNNGQGYDPFRDFFWGFPQQMGPQVSTGSGVIISGDGYIVTNNHVVENGSVVEVTLNDKRTYTAEVVGTDSSTDLALLKIKESKLTYLVYGNSDDVKVGEWVLAVGNPFSLTSTVTAGIVSAKGRNINILGGGNGGPSPIESFIQTDAAVNPGNSGGALVNNSGVLVGINTAIASNTGSYTGYSFAIPVNIVKKVVNDLLEFGTIQRAFLGVSIADIDSKLAKDKGIEDLKGVYVNGTTEGGAAEESGIKTGDIITKVAGIEVSSTSSLLEQIGKFRPNDKVVVTVKRGDKEMNIPVTLKNKNGENKLVTKDTQDAFQLLGGTFEPVSKEDMNKLGITNGLQVTAIDAGKLRGAGIKEGFIITSIDKKKICAKEDLKAALENKKGGVLIEGVYPNGMKAYYAFGL